MSYLTNTLGPFAFLEIMGDPQFPTGDIDLVARPGVNGFALWFTGVRGKPFSLMSLVDAPTLGDAYDLYDQYRFLIGAGLQALTWRNINMTSVSIMFAVLDVRPLQIRQVAKFVGGLNSNPGAICRCEWTLIPSAIN